MRYLWSLWGVALVCQSVHAQWMGLDDELNDAVPTTLGLYTTIEAANNRALTLSLNTGLADWLLLDASAAHNELSAEETAFKRDLYVAQLSVLATESLEFSIAYQYEGDADSIETQQNQFAISYSPFPWGISINYIEGDLTVYTRSDLPLLSKIPDHLDSNFDAISLELTWWFDAFQVVLKQQDFNYERDVSKLSTSRRVQFLVTPEALLNSGMLLKQEQSISFSFAGDESLLSLTYALLTSAVDNSSDDNISLDYSTDINASLRLVSGLSQTVDVADSRSITLGLEWSF